MKKKVSIVITAFNEEESISLMLQQLHGVLQKLTTYTFEIIVTENGSFDSTLDILLKCRKKYKTLKIVQLANNVGWDEGIFAGLAYASGDAAIIMVADLQDDPRLIPQFISQWQKGYDIVYTVIEKRIGSNVTFNLGIFIFNFFMSLFTNKLLPENASEYGLLDKKVYKAMLSMPEHNKFFRGLTHWVGFKKISIFRKRKDRVAGKSKATLLSATKFAINGLTSFSNVPLKFSFFIFCAVFVISIASLFFTNYQFSFILFLFSLVFFINAVQSEYLSKMLDEVRQRPHYIVKELYGITQKYGYKK